MHVNMCSCLYLNARYINLCRVVFGFIFTKVYLGLYFNFVFLLLLSQVLFESVRGSNFYGDIAIDDIFFEEHTCGNKRNKIS